MEEGKTEAYQKSACEGITSQGRTEKKSLAELLTNERAIGPLLDYLKSIEVGGSPIGAVIKYIADSQRLLAAWIIEQRVGPQARENSGKDRQFGC